MLNRRAILAFPLCASLLGGGAFWMLLRRMARGAYDPYALDNPLLGHPVPASTPPLPPGPLLVNFFASWCLPCRAEIPALIQIREAGVTLCGVAYKDSHEAAARFLAAAGDPYQHILWDDSGTLAIDWGVSGVPETYLVDRQRVVRARWVGAVTPSWVHDRINRL